MYRIGEFARLSGISEKTLRFYHENGILSPSATNPRTRYRYYRIEQLSEAALILAMRQAGLTLREIKSFSRELRSSRSPRRYLERIRAEFERLVAEKTQALAWVDAELHWMDETGSRTPVVLKEIGAMQAATIRSTLASYSDFMALERQLHARIPLASRSLLRGTLWHRCAHEGGLDGEPFVANVAPTPPDRRPVKASAVKLRTLPGGLMAAAYCANDDAAAEGTFMLLHRWMHAHGYNLAGPKRELYHQQVLEIQFPLSGPAPLAMQAAGSHKFV
jgi:DNA-binding transcriptional MerR regulator